MVFNISRVRTASTDIIIKTECRQVMVIITEVVITIVILLELLERGQIIECHLVRDLVLMAKTHTVMAIRGLVICECLTETATGISVGNPGSHSIGACRCRIRTCLQTEFHIPRTFRSEVIGDLPMKG